MKYINALFICCLIMLHTVCAAKSGPPPSARSDKEIKTTQPTELAQSQQTGTESHPVFIKIVPAPDGEKKSAEEKKNRNKKAREDTLLVNATIGIAVVTSLLAFFTAALWRATYYLAKDAKAASERQAREMKESLAIANDAAQAAISGNELNQKTFISSQRPWVVVHKIIPSSALDLKSGLSFTLVVKNVGNSPGMNVDVGAIMHLPHRGDAHQVHRLLRENHANEREKRTAIRNISFGHLLVPKEEMEITVRTTNDPAEYQKAAAAHPFGEIIILILGQVSYRFGIDESWHESGFMFSVRRRGGINVTLDYMVVPIEEVEIERFPAGFYAT